MPEGHSVHRLARQFTDVFGGRRIHATSPQGRFAEGAALLDGQVLKRARAHGKHFFADVSGGHVLHVHLGMYGAWTFGGDQDFAAASSIGAPRRIGEREVHDDGAPAAEPARDADGWVQPPPPASTVRLRLRAEQAGQLWEVLPFAGENPLPAFQWLILGAPAAIVVLGLFALCTVALPRRTRALTVAGGAVFFFGAIVLEAVPLVFGIGRSTLAYHVATHAEELTEMIGASVLVVAPWAHLHLRPAPGHLQVTADGVPDAGADDVVLGAGPGPAARLDDCD